MANVPTLFLDYDGVLHADAVFLDPRTGKPVLSDEFGTLFEWAPLLQLILSGYPTVELVLSTSWASALSFEEACSYLPAVLAARVVDCVWKKDEWLLHGITRRRFEQMSRYKQIEQYVDRKQLNQWLAIDNDDRGWPESEALRLVKTSDMTGLNDSSVQRDLYNKLMVVTQAIGEAD